MCSNANEHVGGVRAGAVSRHPMMARLCETNAHTVMLSHSVYAPVVKCVARGVAVNDICACVAWLSCGRSRVRTNARTLNHVVCPFG